MANEPERPIEKLLRAAAQNRRDNAGAPFELHPVNRRLLQSEVTRKFAPPQRERRSFAEALVQLWPRLAGGVAILAVLGLAVWVLLPLPGNDKPEAFLAKNLPVSKDMPTQEPLPAATPAPATIASPPAPAVNKQSPMLAYADTEQAARANPAGQIAVTVSPVAADSALAQRESQDAAKLGLAAAQKLADRQEPVRPQLVASAGTPAPPPAGVANGALERPYGFAGQPTPPASLPTSPAAPVAVAMTPAAASVPPADQSATVVGDLSRQRAGAPVVAANESARLAGDKSGQPGAYYKSLAAASSVNRPSPSRVATDSLSKTAPEALQEARTLGVVQQFVQVPPEAKAKDALAVTGAATHAVLASFRVEQAGHALRIVDGDGSVYTGSLQLANANRRARSAKAEAPALALAARAPARALVEEGAPRLDSDRLAQQTYSFRVAGTNRSLQKKVVFTGNLLTAANLTLWPPAATNLSVAGTLSGGGRRNVLSYGATNLSIGTVLDGFQNAPGQPGFLPLPNSRISGKVVVGSGKATEINALPASQ